jgi:hypothetical protein
MTTQFQVGQNLRQMERMQLFHCLQFNDDAVLDKKVDAVPGIDLNAVIDNGQSRLMLEGDSILHELVAETRIVSAFEAAGAKRRVHFESGAENLFRDRSVQAHWVTSVSSVVERFVAESSLQSPVL